MGSYHQCRIEGAISLIERSQAAGADIKLIAANLIQQSRYSLKAQLNRDKQINIEAALDQPLYRDATGMPIVAEDHHIPFNNKAFKLEKLEHGLNSCTVDAFNDALERIAFPTLRKWQTVLQYASKQAHTTSAMMFCKQKGYLIPVGLPITYTTLHGEKDYLTVLECQDPGEGNNIE
jgi:hypothetical protein